MPLLLTPHTCPAYLKYTLIVYILLVLQKKMNITLYYTLEKKMNDTLKKRNNALRKTMQE